MNKLPNGFEQLGYGSSFHQPLCDLLEQVHLLSDLTRREIETLAPYVGAYTVAPDTVIFSEGGKDNFLCFLAEGSVEVVKRQKDDEARVLTLIRAGKTIGEMAFLDKQPHSATVRTTHKEAVVLLLTENSFDRLTDENPRLALKLLWRISQLLSNRLRQTTGQLIDFL